MFCCMGEKFNKLSLEHLSNKSKLLSTIGHCITGIHIFSSKIICIPKVHGSTVCVQTLRWFDSGFSDFHEFANDRFHNFMRNGFANLRTKNHKCMGIHEFINKYFNFHEFMNKYFHIHEFIKKISIFTNSWTNISIFTNLWTKISIFTNSRTKISIFTNLWTKISIFTNSRTKKGQ